jgi:hypothetical protein
MFKIIYRIFFILLISVLVAGGISIFFNTNIGQSLFQNEQRGFNRGTNTQSGFTANNDSNGQAELNPGPDLGGELDFHDEGGSPIALLDLIKNLGTIGLFTAGAVLIQKIWPRIRLLFHRESSTITSQ